MNVKIKEKNRIISVAMPETYLKAIEILIKRGLYPNRSAFMNEALEDFIDDEFEFIESLEEEQLNETFNLEPNTRGI